MVDRSGAILHDSGEGLVDSRDAAAEALRRRREQPLSAEEIRDWLTSYGEVKAIAERVGTTPETRDAIRGLEPLAKVYRATLARQGSFPSGPRSAATDLGGVAAPRRDCLASVE